MTCAYTLHLQRVYVYDRSSDIQRELLQVLTILFFSLTLNINRNEVTFCPYLHRVFDLRLALVNLSSFYVITSPCGNYGLHFDFDLVYCQLALHSCLSLRLFAVIVVVAAAAVAIAAVHSTNGKLQQQQQLP